MGPVTPLLAVAEEIREKNVDTDFYFIGTTDGPEEAVVREYNIEFRSIVSGKLRRYFSFLNFVDLFKIIFGFFQSLIYLFKLRPSAIVSAGGYVAVPVVFAGWLLGIPSIIHQQDVRVGLANKLCAKVARYITVCFPESSSYFNQKKVSVIGNPIRKSFGEKIKKIKSDFGFQSSLPVVLIIGGGTGAESLNNYVEDSIRELVKFCSVIHITGDDKESGNLTINNYIKYKFLKNSCEVLQVADLIVSRAGMGTLTEIAYLSKPSIIIPIPNSHQEFNAAYFAGRSGALNLNQKGLDEDGFVEAIKGLIDNKEKMKKLGSRANKVIKWGAEGKIAELALKFDKKKNS